MASSGEMDCSVADRTAIVTGAGHGFGRAICLALARHGANVWACDLLGDEVKDTVSACAGLAGSCTAYRLDVTDEGAVSRLATEVAEVSGSIDILVNNAGGVLGQTGQPLESVAVEQWRAIFAVNLDGAFLMCRAVASFMKRKRYGRIVNISSGAGRSVSLTGIQAYASAKAGQIGLTRQLAHELGPWGITVNNIAPGFVLSNPTTQKQWESYGTDGQRDLVEGLALRRLGTVEDIANGVLFFASDMASWCTGQVLSIDGGSAIF